MAKREAYMVQNLTAGGRMATVSAHSVRGAVKIYMAEYRPETGSIINVKPRGRGEWASFRVTG